MKKIENMDELLPMAAKICIEENNGEVSTTRVQRRLGLGYPRAARIVDQMEEMGLITEIGISPRKVLLTLKELQEAFPENEDLKKIHPAQFMQMMGADKNKKEEVEKLQLEKIKFFDKDDKELANPEKIINELYSAIAGDKSIIGIDYEDMKKFLLKNNYKVHVQTHPMETSELDKVNIDEKSFAIFILCVAQGMDFPQLLEVSKSIEKIHGKGEGIFMIHIAEEDEEQKMIILY